MENQELLARAIEKWGIEAQQKQVIEECSELITAILQRQRGKCTDADVVTEIADVSIMCEQMKLIYGAHRVDAEIQRKLHRLKERLGYVVEADDTTHSGHLHDETSVLQKGGEK